MAKQIKTYTHRHPSDLTDDEWILKSRFGEQVGATIIAKDLGGGSTAFDFST